MTREKCYYCKEKSTEYCDHWKHNRPRYLCKEHAIILPCYCHDNCPHGATCLHCCLDHYKTEIEESKKKVHHFRQQINDLWNAKFNVGLPGRGESN